MKAAVCVFVRDEERDIAEWLAFQFAVGFDMATDEHRLLFPRFDRNDDEDPCALRFLVGGGEFPRIDGDVAGYGPSSFCGEAAAVLATVKDARRRFAVSFGHP